MINRETESYSVSQMIQERKKKQRSNLLLIETMMPRLFLICAILSILTTAGIVYTLLKETVTFFNQVSIIEFITSTSWFPFFEENPDYGILPLISGTLLATVIAMTVAIPFGLAAAIFLSEYASDRTRRIIKPVLEILAGVPTIVYGFFALTFVTPLLRQFIEMPIFNALSPGLVMGVMIIPMVASLSEDAMGAVPNAIREGAFALGATRLEVAVKVVLPAALSGIIASFVLAISRAIGETMIVTVAAGNNPILGFDPTQSIQTMTAYIVQVSLGDVGFGSTVYYSIYAVGFTLFLFTFLMNLVAQLISSRFREAY